MCQHKKFQSHPVFLFPKSAKIYKNCTNSVEETGRFPFSVRHFFNLQSNQRKIAAISTGD